MLQPARRFWILAALLAANLMVGVLSLYFLRSVNERYAALFEQGAPVIYDLRTMTREVTAVQRLARRIVTPQHEAAWDELLPQMAAARDHLGGRVREFESMAIFKATTHPLAIARINREYAELTERFLQLARANKLAEAYAFNLAELRPCHDRFQQTLDASADYVEEQGRNLRNRYAKESRFFGGVSLAFASVPLVAVVGGVMVMTILIGILFLAIINPRPDRRG